MTMINRFNTKYQGRRYSFGYPACPALEDQAGIWKLLKPEEIGVQLTEGFMMDPEASVSALVFHHPDCIYFGVGDIGTRFSNSQIVRGALLAIRTCLAMYWRRSIS
jgi:hypothetical protein